MQMDVMACVVDPFFTHVANAFVASEKRDLVYYVSLSSFYAALFAELFVWIAGDAFRKDEFVVHLKGMLFTDAVADDLSGAVEETFSAMLVGYFDVLNRCACDRTYASSPEVQDDRKKMESVLRFFEKDSLFSVGSCFDGLVWGIIQDNLEQFIAMRYDSKSERCSSQINIIIEWIKAVVVPFLAGALHLDTEKIALWNHRVGTFAYNKIAEVLIDKTELFFNPGMNVRGFLSDLHYTLLVTSKFSVLEKKIKEEIESKYIHFGCSTGKIIVVFSSVMKALKVVDPTGTVARSIAPLFKNYLKDRTDTVSCVVNALLNESMQEISQTFLHEQKVRETAQWAPTFKSPEFFNDKLLLDSADDGLGALEGLWGSTDSFMEQYRNMLALSLIRPFEHENVPSLEGISEQLDKLRDRFGDSAVQFCDVILADMKNERTIRRASPKTCEVTAAILTYMYWPEEIVEPEEQALDFTALLPEIQDALTFHTEVYGDENEHRRVEWLPSEGSVEMEIQIGNEEPAVITVSMLDAHVLKCYMDMGEASIENVSLQLNMPVELVRKSVHFWCTTNVLSMSESDINTFKVSQSEAGPSGPVDDEMVGTVLSSFPPNGGSLTMEELLSEIEIFNENVPRDIVDATVNHLVVSGRLQRDGNVLTYIP